MKHTKELIDKHCRDKQIDLHQGLNELLDYLIEFFDYSAYLSAHGLPHHYNQMREKSEPLFMVCLDWLDKVTTAMGKGKWLDYFGELYESEYQSKGKASSTGQFFTPDALCDLMSAITIDKDSESGKISDCACGSGRTLLAHFAKVNDKKGYYIAEDIDVVSVKMCALNMMIHGMRGRVIQHDTLRDPNTFDFGFEVNEVRYPFPTPYYSLRRISKPKQEQPEKQNIQKTLFV